MIKFFRKIRHQLLSENKTSKYFKYAIGEIILVVIGILIALQVNKMLDLDNGKQFAIIDFENASKKWIITLLNKAIITDPDGKIINGFANIFDFNFLDQL